MLRSQREPVECGSLYTVASRLLNALGWAVHAKKKPRHPRRVSDWVVLVLRQLFFSVQEGGGAVFVETSNLDGETNLKAKQARSSSH